MHKSANGPLARAVGLLFTVFVAGATAAASGANPAAPVGYAYVHHPVTTRIAAAQSSFDRGLSLIFAYQSEEAEVAFREAARLDPSLAMAWWGIGLSLGPDINTEPTPDKTVKAAEALQRAQLLLADGASASERDYIAALTTRYSADPKPDFDALATAYRDAMRELVRNRPGDPDARALFAEALMDVHPWRLWSTSGEPEEGTEELVKEIEDGLATHPDHMGLTHFYIHAVEASNNPEKALSAAQRLAALPMEPAAAHLVHMPAHIYMRVGDWQAAVEANEHSIQHSLDYRLSNNPQSKRACAHCADFLSYAYMMQGAQANARRAAENYRKMSDDPSNSIAVLVRFRQWDELYTFAEPDNPKDDFHDPHATLGLLHFARGLGYAATGHRAQAHAEMLLLQAQAALAPPAPDFSGPPDVAHVLEKMGHAVDAANLQIEVAILGSRLAESDHHMPQALDLMRKAVSLQDGMPYGEPPAWFYPLRESLGALLLRNGATTEAQAVFREGLRRSPHNPRCLLGLAVALQRAGRAAQARQVQLEFEAAWKHSDTPLAIGDL